MSANTTYTYAEAEDLLARLNGIRQEWQEGAFRARLKHLKKLGVPLGVSPGRGAKVLYTREHLYQWIFCIEFAQVGIDPSWTVEVMSSLWEQIHVKIFKRAEEADSSGVDDLFLHFTPELMTLAWSQKGSLIVPAIGTILSSDIPKKIAKAGRQSRRLLLINLSSIMRMIQMIERDMGMKRT